MVDLHWSRFFAFVRLFVDFKVSYLIIPLVTKLAQKRFYTRMRPFVILHRDVMRGSKIAETTRLRSISLVTLGMRLQHNLVMCLIVALRALLFSVLFLMVVHFFLFVGRKGAELTSIFSLILSVYVPLVRISIATL